MNEQSSRSADALHDEKLDRACGALIGLLIGDAAGAPLEFLGRTPTAADVSRALTMPGGGIWRVAPGQITDDGELMLALAHGLAAHDDGRFDADGIAARYRAWAESSPFDIGRATSAAFCAPIAANARIADVMRAAALRSSSDSKANGALMRAAPLGVWGHRLSADRLAKHAHADSSLSHPNASCRDATAAYVIAVARLVERPGDRTHAIDAAVRWAKAAANDEVRGWLDDALAARGPDYGPHIGFVRIAFTHAFRHLAAGTAYRAAVEETLLGGGDTDTNAAIVGGLLGAADGMRSLPRDLIDSVLASRTAHPARSRPAFADARTAPVLAERLLRIAPADATPAD